MTSNKYIVRQPIKNQSSQIIGYEIRYYGENQAYSSEGPTSSDFAAADANQMIVVMIVVKLK